MLQHLTSSFAAVIITTATRGRCLRRNLNMNHDEPLFTADLNSTLKHLEIKYFRVLCCPFLLYCLAVPTHHQRAFTFLCINYKNAKTNKRITLSVLLNHVSHMRTSKEFNETVHRFIHFWTQTSSRIVKTLDAHPHNWHTSAHASPVQMEGFRRMGKEWNKIRKKTDLSVLRRGGRMWFLDGESALAEMWVMNRCREDRTQTWNYFADE